MTDAIMSYFAEEEKSKEFFKKTIDIYDLFSIISELLGELGIMSEDVIDKNKISFKMIYPIDIAKTSEENVVVFDLYDRTRRSVNGITQLKPVLDYKAIDITTGKELSIESYDFTNTVLLHVYSASSEKLYQILRTLETIFLHYREWFNTNYRVKIMYDGIKTTAESHNLYHNRIYSKTICLTVETKAQFEMNYELVKSIETKIDK